MAEPRRLIDEVGDSDLKCLLQAGRSNGPPPSAEAKNRVMAAMLARVRGDDTPASRRERISDVRTSGRMTQMTALALYSNDEAISKRVTCLTSSVGRQQFAQRLAAIAAGSALLGFAMYGVAHWSNVNERSAQLAPDVAPHDAKLSSLATAEPAHVPRQIPATPGPAATTSPAADHTAKRKVVFEIIPKNATLVLDGREVNWFANTLSLLPGPHEIEISVRTSKCCEPKSLTAHVTPPDDLNDVQRFVWKLAPRPATVALSGAPANAQMSCWEIGLVIGPSSTKVSTKLPDVQWSGRCDFTPPSTEKGPRRAVVTLRAGEVNQIPWPR
ncbi:hypothetical protein [Polyangium aurulentum]|uniref:hypothetical protein n=1 Tax=Polyangium aurulentum TaxID=2567896 RepID=UPI0010AEDB43|nr:hypothetical protein [Polyangium aurulentum]UQA57047.1 hypothetical protein E8A73_038010 [Polyangium aurulentum]